jgi:hypothetical protein
MVNDFSRRQADLRGQNGPTSDGQLISLPENRLLFFLKAIPFLFRNGSAAAFAEEEDRVPALGQSLSKVAQPYLIPDDREAADQAVRQAVQYCWMSLPKERRTPDELEKEIRRIVDRALKDFRDDRTAFGKGDRT